MQHAVIVHRFVKMVYDNRAEVRKDSEDICKKENIGRIKEQEDVL